MPFPPASVVSPLVLSAEKVFNGPLSVAAKETWNTSPMCGDCLTQFIVRLDRPVEPAIAGDSASAATRTCNYPLIVRAERILECPADRGVRPNGAKGKSPLTRRLPPGWVTSLTGMSVTEKNAGSSRKASEMDVSARAAVESTV